MSFVLSKILWVFLSPGVALSIFLAVGLFLEKSARVSLRRLGRGLCFFSLISFLALAVLPIGDWAISPLENRFSFQPPERVDGIVVIGGDEQPLVSEARHRPMALDSMRRYVRVAELARQYPHAKLVFSGGSGSLSPPGTVLDSEVAQALMAEIGVPTQRMLFERASRTTYENAVFSAGLARPQASENWLLVTSAFHMPRAMGCFRKAGWTVFAAPAGYYTTGTYDFRSAVQFPHQIKLLTLAVHEYIGLLSYRLMDRISALWPAEVPE